MRLVLAVAVVLLFIGCGTKVPVATKYKIDTNLETKENANNSSMCKNQTLKVMQSFSSSMLMSKEMHYVVDSNKVYPYSTAQWAITPNRTVSDEYFKMLRDANLFLNVGNSKSRTKATWLLETRVEDFMQYYEKDNTISYVKLEINLTLLNNKNSTVIASKVFKSKIDVDTLDAHGGVIALNKALKDVLSQSLLWLGEECK